MFFAVYPYGFGRYIEPLVDGPLDVALEGKSVEMYETAPKNEYTINKAVIKEGPPTRWQSGTVRLGIRTLIDPTNLGRYLGRNKAWCPLSRLWSPPRPLQKRRSGVVATKPTRSDWLCRR